MAKEFIDKGFVYKGKNLNYFALPVGGIGTGSISFNGWGGLSDFEIWNKANKSSLLGMTHAAVKAEDAEGEVLDARVIQADYTGSFEGGYINGGNNQGFGPSRDLLTGFPHFKKVKWTVGYPFGRAEFSDEGANTKKSPFPGEVGYTVFNPFIPCDEDNSSIPACFIEYYIKNTTKKTLIYTISFSSANPGDKCENRFYSKDGYSYMHCTNETNRNELCVMTPDGDISYQEEWFRGGWFDTAAVYWEDFAKSGGFKNRRYNEKGNRTTASLAAKIKVKAGRTEKVRFVLSWCSPDFENYWNPLKAEEKSEPTCCGPDCDCNAKNPNIWQNYYAVLYKNAVNAAYYSMKNWDMLEEKTRIFVDSLLSSSLPKTALEAITSNMAIIKTTTCLRLEDGSFYAFEGCSCGGGCCEGTCEHVWAYQYALPFLFPRLEKSMRDIEMKYAMRDDGGLTFRVMLPLGREKWGFRPCADGQFSTVFQIYREWKISGDDEWLKSNWDSVKKMLSYAWADTNTDRWDPNKDGYLSGIQHHTLDMELYGANSWLTGFYLLALQTGAQMAKFIGDAASEQLYMSIYEKGRKYVNENLFNGEYFCQKIDYKDKGILESIANAPGFPEEQRNVVLEYWDGEHSEIKYQICEGCGIDQILAGYHAKLIGVPPVFDSEKEKKALESIYKYNFKSMRDVANYCRIYAANDEEGLLICTFPNNAKHAVITIPYTTEAMNGFEYQAAVHMISRGMEKEGMDVVSAIRKRYDGTVRNPYNEIECGSHYARSMASYSLLLVYSGFEYDLSAGYIGFNPLKKATKSQKFFFSVGNAYGYAKISEKKMAIKILSGSISLKSLKNASITPASKLTVNNEEINSESVAGTIVFSRTMLKPSSEIAVQF